MGAVRKASSLISWKSAGRLQNTLSGCVERTGVTLHSGRTTKVRLCPHVAGEGRCFVLQSSLIPASIDYVEESPLCTTLSKDGMRVRTVEHLLSALEAYGVDNCRIEVEDVEGGDVRDFEVPILDGSAKEWVEAIEEVGLEHARDDCGYSREAMAPYLCEPVHILRNDSSLLAFPSPRLHVNCGINFSQAASIGCQWFSSSNLDYSFYKTQIAPARTFCIFEEVEKMRELGLIKGGSLENALVCSAKDGWLNPPLHFDDEPARHKALDLIGDLSLLARSGSQGLPVAHLVAYKIVECKCLVGDKMSEMLPLDANSTIRMEMPRVMNSKRQGRECSVYWKQAATGAMGVSSHQSMDGIRTQISGAVSFRGLLSEYFNRQFTNLG